MKKIVQTAQKRKATFIIGFLILANLLVFVVVQNMITESKVQTLKQSSQVEMVTEGGVQMFNIGNSFFEYIRFKTKN
ncbi:MAG: hypothetical protein ACI8ZN_000096 [Bacteroidia bacterium]|jgi:hypothetical protein